MGIFKIVCHSRAAGSTERLGGPRQGAPAVLQQCVYLLARHSAEVMGQGQHKALARPGGKTLHRGRSGRRAESAGC